MRKLFFISVLALVASYFVSCSLPTHLTNTTRLTNTASYAEGEACQPISAVFADLVVSPKKVKFFYIPKSAVMGGGKENIINTAVREALIANGNADVMVCLEKQISYDSNGKIQSVTITGYPATYKNFRSPSDELLIELLKKDLKPGKKSEGGVFGALKLGK